MINLEHTIEEQAHRVRPMVCAKVNRQDVDDVMQDIRLSFFTAFPRFRGESKLSTYAHSIAQNKIMDYFRNKYREIERYKKTIEKLKHRGIKAERKPKKEKFCTLTGSQKTVLRLVGEGMSNTEIAEMLCISMNTVRSHIKVIYRKLQCGDRVKLALFSYRFFKEQANEN